MLAFHEALLKIDVTQKIQQPWRLHILQLSRDQVISTADVIVILDDESRSDLL